MIKKISIRNFKSLANFDIELGKFNCLIGMNGAGKSTVLQALDFISQLMHGHVDDWLEMREWTAKDLDCKLLAESNITLQVEFITEAGNEVVWQAAFNKHSKTCSQEVIYVDYADVFALKGKKYRIVGQPASEVSFHYSGSLLSALLDSVIPTAVLEFRDALRKMRSLELLSPNLMRRRARTSDKDIGTGGEKLSAFLSGIKGEQRSRLITLLKTFYPRLEEFRVSNLQAGWKKLVILEKFEGQELETEARHMNDGLLRVLAILAEANADNSLLLLDEIENGINPEIIEKLVDVLVNAPRQILVTTHSPMILNYLEDEIAREAVQFVYKDPQGATHSRRFFELARIGEKLQYMGPGEAFVDTDLAALTEQCVAADNGLVQVAE